MKFLSALCSFGALCSCAFFSLTSYAQESPGGVPGATLWHSQADVSDDDRVPASMIGNYTTIDLLGFESGVDVNDLSLQGSSTLFFVLKPDFEAPSGLGFLRIGDIRIYDDRIDYGRGSTPIVFEDGEPKIIAVQIQRPHRYALGRRGGMSLENAALYSMAELIIYPGIHSREELRKVTSYLALKYSITITENKEEKWRDYWTADNSTYWDTRIDRLFKERVIGLGRSDDERFFQTQTVTSEGNEITVALDELRPMGEMPEVTVAEDAFVIFSEREERRTTLLDCSSSTASSHDLFRWKFQLQNWSSDARQILIRIPNTENKGREEEDSLFLSDGHIVQYVPLVSESLSSRIYSVSLVGLQNGVHYFFTNGDQKECDETLIETRENIIIADVANNEGKSWTFEVQSLEDGSLYSEATNGTSLRRSMNPGQYVVSILDDSGDLLTTRVVRIDESSGQDDLLYSQADIRVYPNPVEQSATATLSVRNLPIEEPLQMTITGMGGRVYETAELLYSEHIERSIVLGMPGTYTITLYQGNTIYAVKLIVRSK